MSTTAADNSMPWTQRFANGWNGFWYTPADPLPLGALRVMTGLVALYWHLTYSFDLVRYFGPNGMLPVDDVVRWSRSFYDSISLEVLPPLSKLSPLGWFSDPVGLWIVHGLSFAVLLAFTLGFKTRTSSILGLLVVLSYIHRAPMLVSQLEPVLAMVMFYLCLAPAGAYLSIDAHLAAKKPHPEPVKPTWGANVCLRLLQVHLCGFYLMMAFAKLTGGTSGPVWWSGEAMWWLVARPDSRLVDFTWIARVPLLIDFWTHSVLWFEIGFAAFIWNRTARPLLLVLSAFMWGSLALVTGLTTFCLMIFFAGVVFVPAPVLARWLARCGLVKQAEPA